MATMTLGSIAKGGQKSFAQWKSFFFDRAKVQKAADRGKLRALSKFGSIVRRVAQTSMRYRKGFSRPGTPPSAHKSKRLAALKKMKRAKHNGALLRELLFFAYDPKSESVVVGPLGFKGSAGNPVPALHEFGGTRTGGKGETLEVKNKPGRDLRGKFVSKGVRLVRIAGKALKYPPRPFMGPALDKAKNKFAESFRGVIHD